MSCSPEAELNVVANHCFPSTRPGAWSSLSSEGSSSCSGSASEGLHRASDLGPADGSLEGLALALAGQSKKAKKEDQRSLPLHRLSNQEEDGLHIRASSLRPPRVFSAMSGRPRAAAESTSLRVGASATAAASRARHRGK